MKKLYGILGLSLFCWVLFFTHNVKSHETGEVVKDETARLIHQMSINITNELFKSLPAILDGIAADLRMKSDVAYKCSLQPDNYKNKECQ